MRKLPALTAAAGLVTVFGVAGAAQACVDCIPDPNGGMQCDFGHGGDFGACSAKVLYDNTGHEIPESKYCFTNPCTYPQDPQYRYTYYDYWYYNISPWGGGCYDGYWCYGGGGFAE